MDPDDVEAWQRARGIARSVATIALDQEKLLENSDCWRPPRPGEGASIAVVPLKVLQAFTARVDARQRRIRTGTRSPDGKNSIGSQCSQDTEPASIYYRANDHSPDRVSEQDSEFFVSSAEWPSSPAPGALPPDSSQEANLRSWKRPNGEIPFDDLDAESATKAECCSPLSSGSAQQVNLIRSSSSQRSKSSAKRGFETLRALPHNHASTLTSNSPKNAIRAEQNATPVEYHEGKNTQSQHSVADSTIGARIVPSPATSPLGSPPTHESTTPMQICSKSHSQSLQKIAVESKSSPAEPQGPSDLNSSKKVLDNGVIYERTPEGSCEMAWAREGSNPHLEKCLKLSLPTVQVNRTPDQSSTRKVPPTAWSGKSLSGLRGNEAPVHCSAIPRTTQKNGSSYPQARLRNAAKGVEGQSFGDRFHTSPSARPVSHTGSVSPRRTSITEQPKKRLKIHGDFSFTPTYETPEMVNRVARQDRREFLASYTATKHDLQRVALRTSTESADCSLIKRFRDEYPAYAGDDKHFWNMCRRIEAFHAQDRIEHSSLWDDYIIRNQDEYRRYLLECAEIAEDPLPYDQFYRREVSEPLYIKRVVNLETLKKALNLQNETQKAKVSGTNSLASIPQAAQPEFAKIWKSTPAVMTKHNIDHDESNGQQNGRSKDRKSRRSLPWQQRSPAAIDLTENEISNRHHAQSVELPQPPILPPTGQRMLTQQNHTLSPQAGHHPSKVSTLHKLGNQVPVVNEDNRQNSAFAATETTEWWQDHHTPFKEFVRAYSAIRSGKGNAFAKPSTNAVEKGNSERKGIREPKKWMDVLSWKLD